MPRIHGKAIKNRWAGATSSHRGSSSSLACGMGQSTSQDPAAHQGLIQTAPQPRISAPQRAEKPSKVPLRAWLLPAPSDAQSGPFPATPAGMAAQGGPVQPLPSVVGVQLTFKGDCKALSIYSAILLQGGVGHGASSVCHQRFPLQPPPRRSYRFIPLTSHPRIWSSATSPSTLRGSEHPGKSCCAGTQVLPASCARAWVNIWPGGKLSRARCAPRSAANFPLCQFISEQRARNESP